MDTAAAKEIAGTLDYMAPEQRSGSDVGPKTDIYACGVVLYELLTGEKPAGTDLPSDLNKSVPKILDEAFKRSYARFDKRYASADAFSAALRPAPMVPPLPPAPSFGQAGVAPHRPIGTGRRQCPQCRQQVDPTDQF